MDSTNEPVAWMSKEDFEDYLSEDKRVTSATVFNFKLDIPLYTNPAKELTDEEIMDELVKVKHTWVATTSVWYEFEKEELKKAIRAILRKASEK